MTVTIKVEARIHSDSGPIPSANSFEETAEDARNVRPAEQPFHVGRYIILDYIGHGGMGNVYRAYDPQLDRKVAIKMRRDSSRSQRFAEYLVREAKVMARLKHRHIVAVYDAGECERGIFVAMEFVDGMTLLRWLRARPRSWREILAMFEQAGRGLAAAHAAGVVHLDFKPDNVLVSHENVAQVADFGLARALVDSLPEESGEVTAPSGASGELGSWASTARAHVRGPIGTAPYLAPERYVSGPADPRSDQYSFCVSLLLALLGEFPGAHRTAPPDPSTLRGRVPSWVVRALRRGLAPSPADRYPSMNELLADVSLDRRRRRFGRGLAAVAAVGLLLAGAAARVLSLPGSEAGSPCEDSARRAQQRWNESVHATANRLAGQDDAGDLLSETSSRFFGLVSERRQQCHDARDIPKQALLDVQIDAALRTMDAIALTPQDARSSVLQQLRALQLPEPTTGARRDGAAAASTSEELAELLPPPGAQEALRPIVTEELQGQYGRALARVRGLLATYPRPGDRIFTHALYQQARLLYYLGEPDARFALERVAAFAEARGYYRTASEAWSFSVEVAVASASEGPESGTIPLAALQQRASESLQKSTGRTHEPYLALSPTDSRLGAGMAAAYRDELDAAQDILTRGLASTAHDLYLRAKFANNLASVLIIQEKYAEAYTVLSEAIRRLEHAQFPGPKLRLDLYGKRADLLDRNNARREACRDWRHAYELAQEIDAPHLRAKMTAHVAYCEIEEKHHARALEFSESIAPEHLRKLAFDEQLVFYTSIALALIAQDRHEDALRWSQAAMERIHEPQPLAALRLRTLAGEALHGLGRHIEAEAMLQRALSVPVTGAANADAPAFAWAALGRVLSAEQRPREALAAVDQALNIWSEHPCKCDEEREAELLRRRILASLRDRADQ